AVVSETQLTLGKNLSGGNGITGLTSGDSTNVLYGYWADGGQYGDDGKGMHDLNLDPQFKDPSRTVLTWDALNGGPGTLAHVRSEIIKVNGYDASGNPATFNPAYS